MNSLKRWIQVKMGILEYRSGRLIEDDPVLATGRKLMPMIFFPVSELSRM